MKKDRRELVVIAKCVGCGEKREIGAFDIPQGEQPMCEKCFMPMVAESAEAKKVK